MNMYFCITSLVECAPPDAEILFALSKMLLGIFLFVTDWTSELRLDITYVVS